jgi:peptidoglycan/LPS O-acetylase OafA/YrhL
VANSFDNLRSSPDVNSDKRLKSLDGVRGLAVLIVFLSHVSAREISGISWLNFHGIGHIGVYLFFVLSGYLLTQNLLSGQSLQEFYIRRFFRIVPLYFVVLLIVFATQMHGYYSPRYLHVENGVAGFIKHMLFIQGDGVFWTIAAEFNFYLMLPLFVWAGIKFGARWLALGAAIYFLWFLLALKGVLPPPKLVDVHHRGQFLDVLICGVIAAFVTRKIPEGLIAVLLALTLVVTLACVSRSFLWFDQPFYNLRWLSLAYGIVFALTIVSLAQGNRYLQAIFNSRILRFMGIVGFGWYLLHLQVFQIVNAYINPGVTRFLVATVAIASCSWLAFVLIESPCIRAGKLLSRKIRPREQCA